MSIEIKQIGLRGVLAGLLLMGFMTGAASAQISANETATDAQMEAQLGSSSITISNLSQIAGAGQQSGTFTNGNNPIGIASGVFISTGQGNNFGLAATSQSDVANAGNTPDSDLTAVRSTATNDTAALEMTVTPLRNTIIARMVFASEEYPEYVCSTFNDAFGLFVSGPGLTGTVNFAQVPGSNTDISINTVNNGENNNGQICAGETSNNSGLYNDNPTGSNFIFDGYTDAIEVVMTNVQPGADYTFKMVVADALDTAWDSAVFVEVLSSEWEHTADLSLDLSTSTPTPVIGQPFTITATINNAGPDEVPFFKVADLLPAGLTFVSASGDGTYDDTSDEWSSTASIAANGTMTMDIVVTTNTFGNYTTSAEVIEQWADDVDSTPDDGAGDDFDTLSVDVYESDTSDAPISYGEPRHAATNTTLRLGDVIDYELGSLQSAGATGDGGDDDGLSAPLPTLVNTATSYTLNATVTNSSLSTATLHGWIDFNNNDVFDSGEYVSAPVAANQTDADIALTWTSFPGIVTGETFIRLRLTTSTLTSTDVDTLAADGEVEDYAIEIVSYPVGEFPFSCDATLYQIATSNSTLKRLNFSQSGNEYQASLSNVGSAGQNVNAGWGYSEVDDLIYGVVSNRLWRVDNLGVFTNVSAIPATASNGSNAGDILPDGTMVYKQSNSTFQMLDISDPDNPVDVGDISLTTSVNIADFGYNPFDGRIYGIDATTDRLFYIDISGYDTVGTGNSLSVTPQFFGPATHSGAYGAVWFDLDGNMFAWNNGNDTIYKADIGLNGNGSGQLIEIAVSSDNEGGINDGAFCRGPSPIPLGNLSGTLYHDVDESDSFNTGDTVLGAGIEVDIYDDNGTPSNLADDTFYGTSTTDVNGEYALTGLLTIKTYRVEVDTSKAGFPFGYADGTINPVTSLVVTDGGTTVTDFGFDTVIDFSDAPVAGTTYGEAQHIIAAGIRLGALIDAEAASPANADASGDGGDDDGVTAPTLTHGLASTISVDVTGAGYLQAWIDFDGDNSFGGSGEQIASDVEDGGTGDTDGVANGTIVLSVTPPANGFTGTSFARFRWSTDTGLASTGSATDGEVEDYAVTIRDLDELSFTPDQRRTVIPGTVVLYPHTLYVPEDLSGGTLVITQTSDQSLNWTIWRDVDASGDLTAADVQWVNGAALPATGELGFIVQAQVAGTVAAGWRDISEFTATVTLGTQTRSSSVTDVTDVSGLDAGTLTAAKFLAVDTDCDGALTDETAGDAAFEIAKEGLPGTCVVYRITFLNDSDVAVTEVVVRDMVPAWTSYVAGSAVYETVPSGMTAGTATAPTGGQRGALAFPFTGSLAAGDGGAVSYEVKIDE